MSKERFKTIFRKPSEKINQLEPGLARLWWQFVQDDGPALEDWEARMNSYYMKKFNGDLKKVGQEKTNLCSALCGDSLTWERFITAMEITGADIISIGVELTFGSGRRIDHSITYKNPYSSAPPRGAEAARKLIEEARRNGSDD